MIEENSEKVGWSFKEMVNRKEKKNDFQSICYLLNSVSESTAGRWDDPGGKGTCHQAVLPEFQHSRWRERTTH